MNEIIKNLFEAVTPAIIHISVFTVNGGFNCICDKQIGIKTPE